MDIQDRDPKGKFVLYELVCIPRDGMFEAAVLTGFPKDGYAVRTRSGLNFSEPVVLKPEEAFPWLEEKRRNAKREIEEREHLEWLCAQRGQLKILLAECSERDAINRMSLSARLSEVEDELRRMERDGKMA